VLSSLFLPYPDDLIVLLLLEVLERQDFLVEKRIFPSYNQTFTSFLAWGLAVVQVGIKMGDLKIRLSLSNQKA
jgi:hypothetical protein